MFYLSLCIAVCGLAIYHLSLKRTPHDINPFAFLAIGYVMAAVLCVAGARFGNGHMPWRGFTSSLAVTFALLAAGVLLIEVGTLLCYRYGWPLGTVGPVGNAIASAALLPVAILVFRDKVTSTQVIGLVLVVAGMILMSIRPAASRAEAADSMAAVRQSGGTIE